jgi:hypothetical protein
LSAKALAQTLKIPGFSLGGLDTGSQPFCL